MPVVVLAAARDDQITQIDPCLSNEIGLFLIIEYRDFESIVVWRFVYVEAKFIIPTSVSTVYMTSEFRWWQDTYHLGV